MKTGEILVLSCCEIMYVYIYIYIYIYIYAAVYAIVICD